jgi:hypothetical protein
MEDTYYPQKLKKENKLSKLSTHKAVTTVGNAIFGSICFVIAIGIVAACLGTHTEYSLAYRLVERDFERAAGTLKGSTCLFYSGNMNEREKLTWEASAIKEGDEKCVLAKADLSKNFYIEVWKKVLYQYLPYDDGEFWSSIKTYSFVLMTSAVPILRSVCYVVNYLNPPVDRLNGANNLA